MLPEYPLLSGTTTGEIRNEIYVYAGASAVETAHYGWRNDWIEQDKVKIYTMVNTNPVKFLIATVEFESLTARMEKHNKLHKNNPLIPFVNVDIETPETIEFNWVETGTPFLSEQELIDRGIAYSL